MSARLENWINDDILSIMHQQDCLHAKAFKLNSDVDWAFNIRERNIVESKIMKAKRTFVWIKLWNNHQLKPIDKWNSLKR